MIEVNRRGCGGRGRGRGRAGALDGDFFVPRASSAWSFLLPGDPGAALFFPTASLFEQPQKLFPWYQEELHAGLQGYMSDDLY